MSETERSLSFSITGEFVTRVAREWFWLEKKPWSVVEEFLLSCMCGTDQTREQLVEYARKVVYGQAKFIGNTADDSYALVEDDQDLVSQYRDRWGREADELKKAYRELEADHSTLTSHVIDSGYGWLVTESRDGVDDDPVASSLLKSYMEQDRIEREGHKDNYGWLDPQGSFYPVDWGDHQSWAHDKALELGYVDEKEIWIDSDGDKHYAWTGEEGDILVDRGWALLHSPARGVPTVTHNFTKPLTKAQREFLYGYYADRGLHDKAAEFLEV